MKSSMKFSNVNPGERQLAQNQFQPISVPEEIFKDVCLSESPAAIKLQLNLKALASAQNIEEQAATVNKICKDLPFVSDKKVRELYLKTMVTIYFSSPFKHPVKCSLAKPLSSAVTTYSEETISCIWEVLDDKLTLSEKSKDMQTVVSTTGNLYSYLTELQMKPSVKNAAKILQFLNYVLQSCQDDLQAKTSSVLNVGVCDLLLSASMVLVATLRCLQKLQETRDVLDTTLRATLVQSETLLNHSQLPYDVLCNLGLVIILIMDINSGKQWLNILAMDNELYKVHFSGDVQRLCVCHGLLSGLSQESLKEAYPRSKDNFLSYVLEELLNICSRAGQDGVIMLGVSRTLLKGLSVPGSPSLVSNDILDRILLLIWKQLDHYTDSIRHATQTVLEHILSLHKSFEDEGINVTLKVSAAMQSFNSAARSRFTCLSVMAKHLGSNEVLKQVPNLIPSLTEALLNPTISSQASDTLIALMSAHERNSKEVWISTWVPPLLAILSKVSTEAHNVESVLTSAVKLCPDAIRSIILEALKEDWGDVRHLSVIIMCLKIGRKLGLKDVSLLYNHLTKREPQDSAIWQNVDLFEILKTALTHEHDSIRCSALSVIAETHRSTEPLYHRELVLVQEYLKYNVNYDVPAARQKGLALVQKVLLRIKQSACVLQRNIKGRESLEMLSEYQNFINWLQSFCLMNLFVGANFSRRCWALKILSVCKDMTLLDSSSKLRWDGVFSEVHCVSVLVNVVLMDTFEDNKKMAAGLLKSMSVESIRKYLEKDTGENSSFFVRGSILALSNRPSDTVSAAYILQLALHFDEIPIVEVIGAESTRTCFDKADSPLFLMIGQLLRLLETQLKLAECNICMAALKGPMYGTLFCIRTLLQLCDFSKIHDSKAWNALINDVTTLCFKVNAAVVGVVNSSSPEGHLPMDFGKNVQSGADNTHIDENLKVTAQMVLLCSWRTVKEISLLLGELSQRCPIRPRNAPQDDPGILDEDTLAVIGNHFLTLMEETKHRGAFEQAAVGFRLLVERLWRYTGGDACEWPRKWLNEILDMVQSTSTVSKLCATRRSAGIPFMVQALVGTEPQLSRNRPVLNSTMVTLLELAGPSMQCLEQRTHAFNILRALFRDACLGDFILPYVEEGFVVAIKGFRCKTWSERNSATLLFSALMTRVFGVRRTRGKLSSRNKMTSYTFLQNYPKLYLYLLEEIQLAGGSLNSPTSSDVATLHPVLLLLGRLYPSSLEGLNTSVQLGMFVPWVRLCAGCCVYKTRCLAAEAMAPLIATNAYEKFIVELFSEIASGCDSNTCHGLLLQSVSLLQSAIKTELPLSENVAQAFLKCLELLDGTRSPMVELTLLQAAELILQLSDNDLQLLTSLSEKLSVSLTSKNSPKRLGGTLSDALAGRILLQLQVLLESNNNDVTLALISHPVQEVAKEAVLFVYYLLAGSKDDSFMEELDDEEDGVDDILTVSHEREHPWPLTLPSDKRDRFKSKLCDDKLCGLLVQRILEADLTSDFQKTRYELSALSRLPEEVWSSGELVNVVLKFLDHPQESVKRAALSCGSSYWKYLINGDRTETNASNATEVLCGAVLKMSSVEACYGNRGAAVCFLTEHEGALHGKYAFIGELGICVLWTAAMRLTMDDDIFVRQRAATLCLGKPTLALRAQEIMVEQFVQVLKSRNPFCQATLLLWAFGTVPELFDEDAELEEDRVFDKGEMNIYAEEEILTDLARRFMDPQVIRKLTDEHFRWIYSILFGDEPPKDLELNSAICLFNVVHNKTFCDNEKKSVSAQLMSAGRRFDKILEVMVQISDLHGDKDPEES